MGERGRSKELVSEQLVNKHRKGRKAESRRVISHSPKQGR
jgi:hypothetical protein